MGREYVVAPLRLIVPSVLPGSRGPLLYELSELTKNVHQWNGVPLVAPSHPMIDGVAVSARHPKVMEKYGIGFVYNARVGKSLDADGFFDKEWTRRVDSRILTALTKGTKLELSTGLFTTDVPVPEGSKDSNGVTYNAIARDHKPDHCAILTDGVGACSLKSGCGVLVNQRVESFSPSDLMTLNALEGDTPMSKRTIWQRLGMALGLINNELSYSDIRRALNDALQSRFGTSYSSSTVSTLSPVSCYVVDVFTDYVVYEEYSNGSTETYKLGYTVKDDVVTLSAEAPVPVQKVTSYKVTGNSDNGNSNAVTSDNTVITALTDNADSSVPDWDTGLVVNPYPSEHAARMMDPASFEKDSFRRKNIAPGVTLILGKKAHSVSGSMVVQAYRFDASKFTAEEAKKWLKDHNIDPMMFEPAKTTNNSSTNNLDQISETVPPVNTTTHTNDTGDIMPLTPDQKTQIVNSLVANCNCSANVPWKGKDTATLNGLDDSTLSAYNQWNQSLKGSDTQQVNNQGNNANPFPVQQGQRVAFVDVSGNQWMLNPTTNQLEPLRMIATTPINNGNSNSQIPVAHPVNQNPNPSNPTNPNPVNNGKGKTMEAWLADMPPQAQSVWNTAMETFNREKTSLVEQLVANMQGEARDQATGIYNAMDVNQLKVLVAGLPPRQEEQHRPVVNYFGAAGPVHTPVINEEPLLSPVYDFSSNGK